MHPGAKRAHLAFADRASICISVRPRLVADEPMETKPIDNLAIQSAPRLGGKVVNDPAANSELVEPLMENHWFRGPQ